MAQTHIHPSIHPLITNYSYFLVADVTLSPSYLTQSVPETEVMAVTVTEAVEPNRSVAQEASSSSGGGGRGSQSGLPTGTGTPTAQKLVS